MPCKKLSPSPQDLEPHRLRQLKPNQLKHSQRILSQSLQLKRNLNRIHLFKTIQQLMRISTRMVLNKISRSQMAQLEINPVMTLVTTVDRTTEEMALTLEPVQAVLVVLLRNRPLSE